MKYAETLKPGFYFKPEIKIQITKNDKIRDYVEPARCIFITGALKGNKWVDFENTNPKWMALAWTSINKDFMTDTTYHINNPTNLHI